VRRDDAMQPGITDLVVPIRGRHGDPVAALTVPYVATSFSETGSSDVLAALLAAGKDISARLQGISETSTR